MCNKSNKFFSSCFDPSITQINNPFIVLLLK